MAKLKVKIGDLVSAYVHHPVHGGERLIAKVKGADSYSCYIYWARVQGDWGVMLNTNLPLEECQGTGKLFKKIKP
jgi:hypothetical protein